MGSPFLRMTNGFSIVHRAVLFFSFLISRYLMVFEALGVHYHTTNDTMTTCVGRIGQAEADLLYFLRIFDICISLLYMCFAPLFGL